MTFEMEGNKQTRKIDDLKMLVKIIEEQLFLKNLEGGFEASTYPFVTQM